MSGDIIFKTVGEIQFSKWSAWVDQALFLEKAASLLMSISIIIKATSVLSVIQRSCAFLCPELKTTLLKISASFRVDDQGLQIKRW